MKKQIIASSIIATAILGGTVVAVLNNANATKPSNTDNTLVAVDTALSTTSQTISSKNETVYVMADKNGAAKSKFIGSTLYSGTKELPFELKITYYLDGQEISAEDLAGKSGHIKIIYNYNPIAMYQGKYIPFVAVTGITLDHTKFSNVKTENGKIVSESSDNYIIAGYGITGINQNLGTDFIPDNFVLEADTTDFKLGSTYTILMNELLADIDTSKLNSLDSLTNSVYELSNGLDQIISGTNELSNGLSTALDGVKTLYAGSEKLAAGAKTAVTGSAELSEGLDYIVSNNSTIKYGANTVVSTVLEKANKALNLLRILGAPVSYDEITVENYAEAYDDLMSKLEIYRAHVAGFLDSLNIQDERRVQIISNVFNTTLQDLTSIKSLIDLNLGMINYADGVATAATGASELSNGLAELSTGSEELSAGLGSLVAGETKLYEGSVTLKDGLNTFKTAGIDKLVNFASKDLTNFTANLRTTINAAASYRNFDNTNATSVKFIIKTPSI